MNSSVMSAEEVSRRLKLAEETSIDDFIIVNAEGREIIGAPKNREKLQFVTGVRQDPNGAIVGLSLKNGLWAHNDGCVYLIGSADGCTKIGRSLDVNQRLGGLQTNSPHELTLLGYVQTARYCLLEAELHERFQDKRVRGEWFRLTEDDINGLLAEWKLDDGE